MKIFNKFNQEELLKIYKEYSLDLDFIIIAPNKPSEELSLLLEYILKNRPLFQNKRKFIRISEVHLYNYLESVALTKRIILKSNLSYYDPELISSGLTKIKVNNVNYYVAK